ncbi:MAG: barstar family protein [Saprospiraceae bacterium]
METVYLDGSNFNNLNGFYDEVANCLTYDATWTLGRNLDIFDDVLVGGYGPHVDGEPIKIIWLNAKRSKRCLGSKGSVEDLQEKISQCHPSKREKVRKEFKELNNRKGEFVFDTIVEIFERHDHVTLELR